MVWWTGLVECGICRERHVQVIEISDGDTEPLMSTECHVCGHMACTPVEDNDDE